MLDLNDELERLAAEGLYRRRRVVEAADGPLLRVDGREVVGFCSNDYLGLAGDPRVVAAFRRGAERYGVGSGASHLISGHSRAHHELEEALAAFTGRPRALLFSTGYMANLGVVSALAGRHDGVVEDRLNHASLIDAARLAGARLKRFAHNDLDAARARLAEGAALIAIDGVFSMDGDLAPLPELAAAAQAHGARLMVDDAHGLGVLGAGGGGSLEHFGLGLAEVPILMGTLGKGLGTFGAFVAGEEALIEYLIQRARSYIYTTALPPAVAEATREALRIAGEEGWRRQRLVELIARFRRGAEERGLALMDSPTPIQPLPVGDSAEALRLGERLLERGLLVTPIRPPTVPRGTARLRVTLSAMHTEEQVERLLDALV
ncbi:8-amino-7-oxononanoate synthase [Endothiovibrio diazotrophicus]